MHLFIKDSIFHHFWPKFRPRCWDIFSISGNTLMNNFFSIVISNEKGKNDCVRFCGSDAPFHQTTIFHNYWTNFGHRFWDIFSISGNALVNPFSSIVLPSRKSEIRFCEVLRIRWTFSSKIQFFIIFGPNLGPDVEIFSQFQEIRLWITPSAS